MKLNITFNGQTKSVNFTNPQAAIMRRLLNGEKVTMINTHHRDGGDFVWYRIDGNYFGAESVGYRAFNGACYAIRKEFGLNTEQMHKLYEQYEA